MYPGVIRHSGTERRWQLLLRCTGCVAVICILSAWVWWLAFALPDPLFDDPYSTVLLDREEGLLGARIARDQQWRFPEITEVPPQFAEALITFEDKRFYQHPGVDFIALARAFRSNMRARRVVSGGSTLTMQLIRISRKGQSRSIGEKCLEILLALRAELRYSKSEILQLYASHAPFGGNVVGLEAASWRYFGKAPDLLSPAEAACLAVLPNSPALIHPGRGRQQLQEKRDALLLRMAERGILDSLEAALAILEPLPDAPHPLPDLAPHLLAFLHKQGTPRLQSTIRRSTQEHALYVLQAHHAVCAQNGIQNGAILVMDTGSGEVLAYVGNVYDPGMRHENAVDMIQASRSSGSVLKPFLYASALTTGKLLPGMLLEDIPSNINGYQPQNFSRTYSGMVTAVDALQRSLNVPAVILLRDYGVERFRQDLIEAGLSTIRYNAEHYGLPLVLGGAETTLWDLCGVYAGMGRMLSHAYSLNHQYDPADLHPPVALMTAPVHTKTAVSKAAPLWDYGALWHTMESLRNLTRPDDEGQWEYFQSGKPVAWKTGTSFGFRDAWAIGVTPEYTVGVWIGNADGEGRPGLMGVRVAAPVMFDVFRALPGNAWWSPPYDALTEVSTCKESGYLAGHDCPGTNTTWIVPAGMQVGMCPFHQRIYTDAESRYRYTRECADAEDLVAQSWFVIPPAAAQYYRKANPGYLVLPPMHPGCDNTSYADTRRMQLIYPAGSTRIFIPRELNGNKSATVFRAAHRSPTSTIHWYMDDTYMGSTREFHSMEVQPDAGRHRIIIVDDRGERIERTFEVMGG